MSPARKGGARAWAACWGLTIFASALVPAGPVAAAGASDDDERAAEVFENMEARERFVRDQAAQSAARARRLARELLRLHRREPLSLALPAEERRTRAVTFDRAAAIVRRDLDEWRTLRDEADRLLADRRLLVDVALMPSDAKLAVAPPVAGTLVGPWGLSKEPATGIEVFRTELQYLARGGDTVRAPAAGVVKRIARGLGGGFEVVIAHDGGFTSVIGGLGEVAVEEGQRSAARGTLGFVGRTADAAPIITWGLWRGRSPVNPRAMPAPAL